MKPRKVTLASIAPARGLSADDLAVALYAAGCPVVARVHAGLVTATTLGGMQLRAEPQGANGWRVRGMEDGCGIDHVVVSWRELADLLAAVDRHAAGFLGTGA
jgi:hypothetical protein